MWARTITGSPFRGADLVGWRRRQLLSTGFNPATASALAHSAVDLHRLIELVDRGCPPHLAARIMAPLDVEVSER